MATHYLLSAVFNITHLLQDVCVCAPEGFNKDVVTGKEAEESIANAPYAVPTVTDGSLKYSNVLLQLLLVLHCLIKLLLEALSPALPHGLSLKL